MLVSCWWVCVITLAFKAEIFVFERCAKIWYRHKQAVLWPQSGPFWLCGLDETTGHALVSCGLSCNRGSTEQNQWEFSRALSARRAESWQISDPEVYKQWYKMLEGCLRVVHKKHHFCSLCPLEEAQWLINVCVYRQPHVRRCCCPYQPYLTMIQPLL